MAKGIYVSEDLYWSATFGVFEWVLEYLLTRVDDPATSEHLKEVIEHNLGVVVLRELPPAGREQILQALRDGLAAEADRTFALHLAPDARQDFLDHVKALIPMAEQAVNQPPGP